MPADLIAAKTTNGYKPKDTNRYAQMRIMFAGKSQRELEIVVLLFLFDMSFDRGDIAAALSEAEKEARNAKP